MGWGGLSGSKPKTLEEENISAWEIARRKQVKEDEAKYEKYTYVHMLPKLNAPPNKHPANSEPSAFPSPTFAAKTNAALSVPQSTKPSPARSAT